MAGETIAQAISGIRNTFPNMDNLNNEEDAKLFVIERILYSLGWNLFDPKEMKKEFQVGIQKADYALNPDWPTADVFIEAKKPAEKLDKHQGQLLTYCVQQAVNLGVLTNGRTWWLYLPEHKGPQGESLRWSQKRFSEIDIIDGIIDGDRRPSKIPTALEKYLAKEKVVSGEAIEAAKGIIDGRIKEETVKRAMVDAWNNVLITPSEDVIKLFTESTASLCNVKPNKQWVKEFFQNHKAQFKVSHSGPVQQKSPANSEPGRQHGKPSFILNDIPGSAKTWKQLLLEFCKLMYVENQAEFDRIMNVQGRNTLYFSKSSVDLKDPKQIGDSGIFAATAPLSQLGVKQRCRMVLEEFGYPEDSLKI